MARIVLALLSTAFGLAAAEPRFVFPLPAESTVKIHADLVYKTTANQSLHFDLYRPANYDSRPALPVVVFMQGTGSGDVRKWAQYTGWGKLVTAIGMAGVVYDSHEGGVIEDATDLLGYLRRHAEELHIDAANVVLWACSANVRAGLPLAMDPRQTAIKAAVFYYGVTEEKTGALRMDVPMLVVRAGLDGVELNRDLDRLVARASAMNVPLTFMNVPAAHHAFDIVDDNNASRAVIARTLDFIKTQTTPSAQSDVRSGVADATAAASVYREDWAAAVKAYEALTGIRAQDSELRRNFGNALYGAGQFKRAIAEYERALELGNPNVGWISYSTASAWMKLGDKEAALQWIEKLKDIVPMRRRLLADPGFASLKDYPRFKAVAELGN